jgi:WD40 repeat protein
MARWFIRGDRTELGPYSALRLKEMAVTGELTPDDLVRREDMDCPRPASEIKGLVPSWYILKLFEQEGPHDGTALQMLISIKDITEHDLLRRFDWLDWREAPAINGIMQLVCPLQATFMTISEEDQLEGDCVWHVLKSSKQQGPFTTAQIVGLARVGELLPDDLVKHPDEGDWKPARSFPLFDEDELLASFYGMKQVERCRQDTTEFESQAPVVTEAVRLDAHTEQVTCLAFSHNGKWLASAGRDDFLTIWDVTSREEAACFTGLSGVISSLCFSPDDKFLAAASRDGSIRVWEIDSEETAACLKGHTEPVNTVTFLPDGNTLVSGGDDQTIRVWNVETGEEQNAIAAGVVIRHFSLSATGSHLLVAGSGELVLWNLETTKVERDERVADISRIAVSDLAQVVAARTNSRDNTIQDFVSEVSAKDEAQGIVRFDDIDLRGTVYVWDQSASQKWVPFVAHRDELWSIAFMPNSTILASASSDGSAKLWEVTPDGAELICTFRGHNGAVYDVAFSPDSNLLATAGEDGTVRLWDLRPVVE